VSWLGVGATRARRRPPASALAPSRAVERLLAGNAWLVFAFLYLPILALIVLSFNDNRIVGVWSGASLRWYRELAGDRAVLSALRNSLLVAVVSTVIATALGTAAAIALERYRWRGRRTFDGMLFLPVIIPDVTMAVMMLLFFVQVFRLVGNVLGFTGGFGLTTIVLSHVAFNVSFVAIVVRARLAGMRSRPRGGRSRPVREPVADASAT
jgi:spermidine/putrescine transport system permease protein